MSVPNYVLWPNFEVIDKCINPISPGRFNTFSTWGGADSTPLRNFAFLDPN